ncbi:MAG: CBS domain-containing protein, partial [Tissierellia bacterium]|nr:CBS domain-containing protein [Tissierellia bacterium]
MNLDNYCIYDDDNLKLALEKIDKNKHGFLIVLNSNKKVIGTLTDGDIRRSLINEIELSDEVGQVGNL